MMRKRLYAAKAIRGLLFYAMLAAAILITVLPFLWMLSSSFKGSEAIRTIPIRWIPERPTLEGYERVFNMQGFSFSRASLNSLLLAVVRTAVAVISATMAAFVFAKLPFRGSGKVFGLYLATMMIPETVTMVPNYIILRMLGLLDTYTGLVLPALANAFGVYSFSFITARTFSFVFGLTFGLLLTTLDTVAIETFASFAISYIFTIVLLFVLIII